MRKFKTDRKCVFFSLISLMLISVFAFGSASWTMVINKNYGSDSINKVDLDEGRVVCYINENNEANQYRSVEVALAKAKELGGGTVYIIPTPDGTVCTPVHIKCNVTIASGVTLSLPYSGTTIEADDNDARAVSDNCADSSMAGVNKYRRTQVILDEGFSITVESGATLSIGGINGVKGAKYGGIVSGNYSELSMSANSQIINNGGNINCYGYIKEYKSLNNGSLITLNSGIMICPLSIYDYQGGTATLQMLNNSGSNKVCPFTSFDLASIQVKTRVCASGLLNVKASLYVSGLNGAGAGFYPSKEEDRIVTMIGDSTSKTVLQLSRGYIDVKYTPNVIGLTSGANDGTKTIFNVFGGVSIGSFSLTIQVPLLKDRTLDTSQLFFPISWRLGFCLFENSNVTFGQKIKFLPGSFLNIYDGATLNITSQVVFYPKKTLFDKQPIPYRTDKNSSFLSCDGALNITGSFGGEIITSSSSGEIKYDSSHFTVTSVEPNESPASSSLYQGLVAMGSKDMKVSSTTYNAAYVSDASGNTTNITSTGTYKSQGNYFVKQ